MVLTAALWLFMLVDCMRSATRASVDSFLLKGKVEGIVTSRLVHCRDVQVCGPQFIGVGELISASHSSSGEKDDGSPSEWARVRG